MYLAPNLIPSHATHTAIPASSATQEERSFSWLSALSCELMPSMNSHRGQLSYPYSSCHPDFLSMCHALSVSSDKGAEDSCQPGYQGKSEVNLEGLP